MEISEKLKEARQKTYKFRLKETVYKRTALKVFGINEGILYGING